MTKEFLEITDLPSDNLNVFHGLRTPLIKVFNQCREHPYKMTELKQLLKFMYNTVVSFEANNKSTPDQSIPEPVKALEINAKEPETASVATKLLNTKDAK
jgi:hypothetical protein